MSRDRLDQSRRSFLLTLGGAAAGSLVTTPFARAQSPHTHVKKHPRGGQTQTLAQSDIEYLGFFKLPNDPSGTRFGFSSGALTARTVNGNLQFLIAGARTIGDPIYEISYPGYGSALATAPVASLITSWGDIYQGRKLTYRKSGANVRGLLWRPEESELFWTYGDPYNASSTSWDPSIGLSLLNASGGVAGYGPWRTNVPSQQTRGYMMPIPSWFSSQYVSGMPFSVGAPITSGNAESPWGAAAMAWMPPDLSTPPDPVQSGSTYRGERASIPTTRMLFHDINHRQPRDANYKYCGWNVQYNCSAGSTIAAGAPVFQEVDTVSAATWIDLPDKRGVVFFGQLATKLDGFDYGSDTLPHIWYGVQYCCHGQNGAPMWMATGPGTPTSLPHIWIYDPNDLGSVADGQTPSYGLTPKAVFPVSAISGAFPKRVGWYYWGGAHFDPASRLLFVTTNGDDAVTNPYEPRPVIRVFRING